MFRLASVALAIVALAVLVGAQSQDRPDLQLKAAVYKETVEGDLHGAIAIYKQIVSNAAAPRPVAAAALLGLGGCYDKLGEAQTAEARKAYERLVAEYSDQSQQAAQARARLARLPRAASQAAAGAARGMTLTKIYSGGSWAASISPDGKRLVLSRSYLSSRDLWARDVVTGKEVRLTSGANLSSDPVWSPDSRAIAFADQRREIKIIPAEGGVIATVFTIEPGAQPTADLAPTNWTADSKQVVFRVPGKGLFAVPAAGGRPVPVCTFGNPEDEKRHGGLTSSPDGRWVAYSAAQEGNTDIFVMPTLGGRPIRVTTSPAAESKPRWSPDGNWLAFTSLGNENPQIWATRLSRDGRPEGLPVQVSGDSQIFGGHWTSDGRVGFSAAFRTEHVFTANADGTGETQLTQFSSFHAKPRWSPDGRSIAFRSDYRQPLNKMRLWTLPSAGGVPRLASDKVVGSVFVWSGDGEKFLVETGSELNRAVIMGIPARGGEPAEIMTIPADIDGLSLSSDGRNLYYTFTIEPAQYATTADYLRERASGIGAVPAGGGEPRILIPADRKGVWYSDCRVDPSGKRVAFMVFDNARYKQQGMYAVWVLDVNGGEPRKLTDGGEYYLCWSPDGKWIVYEQRVNDTDMDFELYKVPASGGEPVRMNIKGRSAEFSPDGKRIAYTKRIDAGYEYWLAEHVLPPQAGKMK